MQRYIEKYDKVSITKGIKNHNLKNLQNLCCTSYASIFYRLHISKVDRVRTSYVSFPRYQVTYSKKYLLSSNNLSKNYRSMNYRMRTSPDNNCDTIKICQKYILLL